VNTREAGIRQATPPPCGVGGRELEQRNPLMTAICVSLKGSFERASILRRLFSMSRGWDTRSKLKTVLGVDLAPRGPLRRERAR